jgi:hypothetical protein
MFNRDPAGSGGITVADLVRQIAFTAAPAFMKFHAAPGTSAKTAVGAENFSENFSVS